MWEFTGGEMNHGRIVGVSPQVEDSLVVGTGPRPVAQLAIKAGKLKMSDHQVRRKAAVKDIALSGKKEFPFLYSIAGGVQQLPGTGQAEVQTGVGKAGKG